MPATIELSGGLTAEELPSEQQEQYVKDFTGVQGNVLRIRPGGSIVMNCYKHFEKDIYNFKFRPDDVLVMTYPKSGTTWMQEIVWNMRNNPNLDHPNPNEPSMSKSPFLEMDMMSFDLMQKLPFDEFLSDSVFTNFKARCPDLNTKRGLHIQVAESYTEPRVLKTHMPFSCYKPGLIDTCKVVSVIRHPKDLALSYQHHCRLINVHGFTGTQDEFIKYFVEDLVLWGSYGNMVREAMQLKSHPNMHIMYYEDMKADIGAELRRLNDFLGTKLNAKQLKNVAEETSFSSMQKNDSMKMMDSVMCNAEVAKKDGGFVRHGLSGAWKGKMTQHQEEMIDEYIAKNFVDDPEILTRYQ